jgi:hypothetical protein
MYGHRGLFHIIVVKQRSTHSTQQREEPLSLSETGKHHTIDCTIYSWEQLELFYY